MCHDERGQEKQDITKCLIIYVNCGNTSIWFYLKCSIFWVQAKTDRRTKRKTYYSPPLNLFNNYPWLSYFCLLCEYRSYLSQPWKLETMSVSGTRDRHACSLIGYSDFLSLGSSAMTQTHYVWGSQQGPSVSSL